MISGRLPRPLPGLLRSNDGETWHRFRRGRHSDSESAQLVQLKQHKSGNRFEYGETGRVCQPDLISFTYSSAFTPAQISLPRPRNLRIGSVTVDFTVWPPQYCCGQAAYSTYPSRNPRNETGVCSKAACGCAISVYNAPRVEAQTSCATDCFLSERNGGYPRRATRPGSQAWKKLKQPIPPIRFLDFYLFESESISTCIPLRGELCDR